MSKIMWPVLLMSLGFFHFAAAEMNVPIQLKLKSPGGAYPTESGLNLKLLILSPSTNCILREESFSGQTITNGNISLSLGSGTRGVNDPSLTLNQAYDNSKSKTGLSCVDANNNIISTGQVYSPTASDERVIRVLTTVSGDAILANFNMRATPYAIQAESVGGKAAADIIVSVPASQMNQINLNDLLLDVTRFNNLKSIALSGQATSATTATNFSGPVSGDVSGNQGAISVDRIKGVAVSSTAPTAGQVLVYDGTKWVPSNVTPTYSKSTADQTFAVTAQADVTSLSFAVQAGLTYKYKFNVMYTSALTSTGLRLGLTYPAVTSASSLANIASGIDGTGAYFQGVINISGDSVMSAATPAAAPAVMLAFVEGVIVPTAAGTVQLRAATEIAGSNIVILAGSFVEVAIIP